MEKGARRSLLVRYYKAAQDVYARALATATGRSDRQSMWSMCDSGCQGVSGADPASIQAALETTREAGYPCDFASSEFGEPTSNGAVTIGAPSDETLVNTIYVETQKAKAQAAWRDARQCFFALVIVLASAVALWLAPTSPKQ